MSSRSVKFMACVFGLALAVTASVPAEAAKVKKHKRIAADPAIVVAKNKYRGANLFPAGPVYFGNDYMGDDPDPFIRLQLQRDISRYGGEP